MWKWIKRSILLAAGLAIAGFCVFGKDVYSYVTSSGRMLQQSVQDSVPFEFQIQRARHLLDELIPQMHANIKLIAQEEVEVVNLEKEIARERQSISEEKSRVQALRDALKKEKASYRFGGHDYSRVEVVEELARRFEQFQTAELLLASKEKLLSNRQLALGAARKKLDTLRTTRLELAAQVEGLESQFRLIQAESASCQVQFDDSKLSQVKKVLSDLRKRLDVAQRVLAHESRFIENIPVESLDEGKLLESVDAHFSAENDGTSL
jgi:hypothetical protein